MTESRAGRDLAHALVHARILRGAGDPVGAARLLDEAFADEGIRARPPSEVLRFRAMVLRADIALQLNDYAGAERARESARTLRGGGAGGGGISGEQGMGPTVS